MPEIPNNQRVVLEHRTGRFRGLFQIMGHVSEFQDGLPVVTPPTVEWPRKDAITACIVASRPRYVLYREITAPDGLGTFDRRQR